MPYSPINDNVYTAAFSGAMAGMAASGRQPTQDSPSDYVGEAAVAGAFAQEMDIIWASATANVLDVEIIEEASEGVWAGRFPTNKAPFNTPGNWETLCSAIIAMVMAAEAYYAGQGITPPPIGGGGTVIVDGTPGPSGPVSTIAFDPATFTTTIGGGTATVVGTGGGGGGSTLIVPNLLTGAMTTGRFAYLSSADTCALADSSALASSYCVGMYDGVATQVTAAGNVLDAAILPAAPMPVAGAPLYLATAGTLTGVAPTTTGQILCQVGICIDPINWGTHKTVRMLVQISPPIQL